MSNVSEASAKGFVKASLYDAHRPSYATNAVDLLLKKLLVKGVKGARILDLGAGTGKFTELLSGQEENFDIVAVEPQDEMRAELVKKRLNNVEVLKGDARSIPTESQSFDAVIAAQSFHWFANMEALHEIYRVLGPGNILGMVWNIEDYNAPSSWEPTTIWEAQLKDITWSSGNETARVRHEQWRSVFDNQIESTPFTIQAADPLFSLPLGQESIPFRQWLMPDAVWNRYRTLSQFAMLDDEQLEALKSRVYAAMSCKDIEKNEEGEILVHGRTVLAWTTAIPGAPLRDGG